MAHSPAHSLSLTLAHIRSRSHPRFFLSRSRRARHIQAAEKEGLRAWFRPGRLWTGEISIPGGAMVGRCRLTPGFRRRPHACFQGLQLLKLKYDKLLSNFAFNCNLRHYTLATKSKYIFQVIEWNHTAGCWIVSHAAHGDEQLCHLKIEEDKDDSSGSGIGGGVGGGGGGAGGGVGGGVSGGGGVGGGGVEFGGVGGGGGDGGAGGGGEHVLRLSFSDAETHCTGIINAAGVIRGAVGQLVRPEEGFWQEATEQNQFRQGLSHTLVHF